MHLLSAFVLALASPVLCATVFELDAVDFVVVAVTGSGFVPISVKCFGVDTVLVASSTVRMRSVFVIQSFFIATASVLQPRCMSSVKSFVSVASVCVCTFGGATNDLH